MSTLLTRLSLALLLLAVGVLSFKVLLQDRAHDASVSDTSGSYDGDSSGIEHSPRDTAEAVFPAISTMSKEAHPSPIEEVFDLELSLIEGINQMALSGRWGYDEKVKNLALWEGLCLASDERISALIDGPGDAGSANANLKQLCQDFSAVALETDDFFEVEIEERALGVNERAVLETSLDDLGPDAATVLAIAELSRALESLDYAKAVEVVWFLGIYNFDGVSQDLSVYRRQPGVETIFAVSASIFCNYIRGCGHNHPVVLNLCFQFPDLPCSRQPAGIYDAVDQILTGYELETFSEMNNALIRLLNRYHRGDL